MSESAASDDGLMVAGTDPEVPTVIDADEFEQAKKEPAATRYDSLPPVPKDRTVAVTVGRWGGFYKMGGAGCWRVCLGFVAITYFRAEFSQVMAAWLDRVEAS